MKARTLSFLLGGAATLIATTGAQAEYLGIVVSREDTPFGGTLTRVYAVFDRPGQDAMIAVAGTPNTPLSIQLSSGTFFQSPVGNDLPPFDALFDAFPMLAYDSFVTIGVKSVGPPNGQPADTTFLTPGWPGFGASSIETDNSSWVVVPGSPQADPFDPVNSFPGDGRILIGQFSHGAGVGIVGTMLLQYRSNGVNEQSIAQFFDDFPHCIDDVHCVDDPCTGGAFCKDGLCELFGPSPDCNGNGVHDTCESPNPCPGNIVGGCSVGIGDFLQVLADWGPCVGFCPADIDGDNQVGIVDLLELLANWGPCPLVISSAFALGTGR